MQKTQAPHAASQQHFRSSQGQNAVNNNICVLQSCAWGAWAGKHAWLQNLFVGAGGVPPPCCVLSSLCFLPSVGTLLGGGRTTRPGDNGPAAGVGVRQPYEQKQAMANLRKKKHRAPVANRNQKDRQDHRPWPRHPFSNRSFSRGVPRTRIPRVSVAGCPVRDGLQDLTCGLLGLGWLGARHAWGTHASRKLQVPQSPETFTQTRSTCLSPCRAEQGHGAHGVQTKCTHGAHGRRGLKAFSIKYPGLNCRYKTLHVHISSQSCI